MPNLQLNIDILRKKSIDNLLARLSSASYEFMKYLPLHNLLIYRINDIGIGYSRSISPLRLKELISLGKVKSDIPIYLKWKHGNILTFIDSVDIDLKLLLTDETYIIVHKDTNELYAVSIGKFTNPNKLFYKEHLNAVVTNLTKASSLVGFNRIDISEEEPYLDHIP